MDGIFPTTGQQPRRPHSQHPRRLVSENGPLPYRNGRSQSHKSREPSGRIRIDPQSGETHRPLPHTPGVSNLNNLFPPYRREPLPLPENGQDPRDLFHQNPLLPHSQRPMSETVEQIFEESGNQKLANHLIRSYSSKGKSSQQGNIDAGKATESTNCAVPYSPGAKEMFLSPINPRPTT